MPHILLYVAFKKLFPLASGIAGAVAGIVLMEANILEGAKFSMVKALQGTSVEWN